MRTLKDLPAVGNRLVILLKARKFFCDNKRCRRRVFSERLPGLADLHARSTKRLDLALCEIGHAVGAEGGARLAQALGMPTSGDTVLRRVRTAPMPRVLPAHVIGIDDWAWKKGPTYGTIISDLEQRCPIDLLPDRESESLSVWLRNHPEIQVASRRPCTVDKHHDFLLRRWLEGCQNASQLYRELMHEGFRGSYYAVRRYVKSWRGHVNRRKTLKRQMYGRTNFDLLRRRVLRSAS